MRTRMSGGVGRAISDDGPYPIYPPSGECALCALGREIVMRSETKHVFSVTRSIMSIAPPAIGMDAPK